MLRSLFHISRNTYRECIRQPIFTIVLMTTLTLIGLHPALMVLYTFREQGKLITDGCMATVMLFGWIAAVLCASHAIAREIDTGTVLLILSKPVNRVTFIVAKVLGILGALTLFVWITGIATLMAVRCGTDQFRFDPYILSMIFVSMALAALYGAFQNYMHQTSWPASTANAMGVLFLVNLVVVFFLPEYDMGYRWGEHVGYPVNLVLALILVMFAVWAMGTLATALSTRFNLVSNLSICSVIFVIGLMSDYFYYLLTRLRLEDLTRILQLWHLLLAPLALVFWLLATKHFSTRRNQRVRFWEVHLSFFVTLGILVWRGSRSVLERSYLQDPGPVLGTLAQVVLNVKNQIAYLLHAMIPNWQLFWLADALAAKRDIPLAYMALGWSYILLLLVLFCLLAYALFANREVGKQMVR